MRIQAAEIRAVAAENGFEARNAEKTARRLSLLTAMSHHNFLQDGFALKGGTALPLFVMDMERLSIDIESLRGRGRPRPIPAIRCGHEGCMRPRRIAR